MSAVSDSAALSEALDAFRRDLRLALLSSGAARLAILITGTSLATFALDRLLRLPRGLRALQLAVLAVVWAWAVWRHLMTAALRPLPDGALALELERRTTDWHDAVGSAVDFALKQGEPLESPALRLRTIRRAAGLVARRRPNSLVAWDQVRRRAAGAGVGLALVGVWIVAAPGSFALWAQRTFELSTADWPRDTHLELLDSADGVLRVPSGEDAVLRVQARGELPDTGRLSLRRARSTGRETITMSRLPGGVLTALVPDVAETVSFRVRADDGLLEGGRIEPIERPTVEAAALVVRPPSYIAAEPVELEWNAAEFEVPAGSTATVRLMAGKPIAESRWSRNGSPVGEMTRTGPASFEAEFEVKAALSCTFQLLDRWGIGLAEPFVAQIRAVPDQPPRIRLQSESLTGMVTPDATVPLTVRVSDDYGIRRLWLQIEAQGTEAGMSVEDELPVQSGSVDATLLRALDLSALDMEPGGRLIVTAFARDESSVPAPNTGESVALTFRVVAAQDLLRALLFQQQDARRDLEDQMAREVGLLDAAPDAQAAWGVHRSVASALRGVAETYGVVLAELGNNRLITSDTRTAREVRVVEPLQALVAEGGPLNPPEPSEGGASPVRRAQTAVHVMARVRAQMLLLEDYGALLATLGEVREGQEGILNRTLKLREGLREGLLRDE